MTRIYTPENSSIGQHKVVSVFLAGSIELGKARDWQKDVIAALEGITGLEVYSPRTNADWSNLDITKSSPELDAQIAWEQEKIRSADIVFFMFLGDCKSPITMMEYGQCLEMGKDTVVVVEDGFWRKGNLLYMQVHNSKTTWRTLEQGIKALVNKIRFYS